MVGGEGDSLSLRNRCTSNTYLAEQAVAVLFSLPQYIEERIATGISKAGGGGVELLFCAI